MRETTKVGKRGTIVIPAVLPLETFTPERRAEFLLSNVVDAADYARAARAVRELGLDPVAIPHEKPEGA